MESIGRYKIVRELGRGAMGVVYLATDPTIGRAVAIKTIRLSEVGNPEERARLRERLFREARSAGVLSHPGIVTIYDMEAQGDLAYIAMEYVNGPTLDQLLSGQPLAPERMFSILGQTAAALDYAHQKGIVHRDIKPANIMITEDGSVKITDFGIAKISASDQFTVTGAIVGTPHYMSPEQVQGLSVDGRADQFSLAVIIFEMLTGEKPFTGEQLTTVVYKIVAAEPAAAHRLNPTLNQQITNVLRRGLAKKADARYPSSQKLVEALEAACATAKGWKPLTRGGSLSLPTAVEARRPEKVVPARTAETRTREHRQVGILPVLAAVLVAAGLVGLIAWQAAPWLTDSSPKQAATQNPPPSPGPATLPAATPQETKQETKPGPMSPAAAQPEAAAPPEATEAGGATGVPPPAASQPEGNPIAEPPGKATPAPPSVPAHKPAMHRARTEPMSTPDLRISVATVPADATAMLDGHPDTACTTPCALDASPGVHKVSISRPGYQTENREVTVSRSSLELPVVALRVPSGILMLNTAPAGARIYLNGRASDQLTPARLELSPGSYHITVEKDGKRATQQVEVANGSTQFLRIPLDQ
jgi:serine/threonine-protein kinase